MFKPGSHVSTSASTTFLPRSMPSVEALEDEVRANRPERSRRSNRTRNVSGGRSSERIGRSQSQLRLAPEPKRSSSNGGPVAGQGPRFVAVVLVMFVLAGLLIWRLAHLQVLHPERYVNYGLDQRLRTIELPAGRGDLLDRNGDQLATSLPRTTLFTDPGFVTEPESAARRLAPVLGLRAEEIYARLTADNSFSYLARQVDDETAAAVEALDIEGVFSILEPARFNPAGERLAAGVLGRVGIDNQGLSGLEYAFDDELTGVPGQILLERDQEGNTIPQGVREVVSASPGSDVVLTIDRSLQFEVERLLLDQVDAMGAKGGVVVVTEPKTGEILAMASVETDDAGLASVSSKNLSTTWVFEPGSVMKTLTFATVLNEQIASPESVITVPDHYKLYDQEFSDHDNHEPQDMSVRRIMAESSNVGTVIWAQALGPRAFDRAMRGFGFGSSPELGLPGETAGLVTELDDYDGTTLAASALGQGIAVSATQMLNAYNVVANDGEFVPLRLIREVVDNSGDRSIPSKGETQQVISVPAARDMRSMLRDVVNFGTGTAAQIESYEVAGKTGTARKPQPGGGYLDENDNFQYVSTFVGFLPANDPKISILVAIDEPRASIYASVVAAPTFAEIARYSLRHFQIPPSSSLIGAPGPVSTERANFTPLGSESAAAVGGE